MKTKKILFIVVGVLVILSIFTIFNNTNNTKSNIEQKELTNSQTLSLMKLGLINIHSDIEYSEGDKMTNIVARTPNGNCVIYQDVFGRYYCRW